MAISLHVPGWRTLRLEHLVLDYNGTLALDGRLAEGVAERISTLRERMRIHVLTADTFGMARAELGNLDCELLVIEGGNEQREKSRYLERLGTDVSVAIGNGRNDREMLARAALAIAVLGPEGLASEALAAADIVVPHPASALDLLIHPQRIVATLRS
jgi:soluble P-type ATPase